MVKIALVLLLGIIVLFIIEQRRAHDEVGEVLSAYLSDEIQHDVHDWGSGAGVHIILQREAQVPIKLRGRWAMLFDSQPRFPEAALATRVSFVVRNVFATHIQAELRLPKGVDSVVVNQSQLKNDRPGNSLPRHFNNSFGYIAVSQPGFNSSKTEAIFYIDHFCGLCGGGGYILMRKIDGVWRVADQHSTWVS
ncbi:MAG TPA: hypothetical protein VHA33_26065 [Candidatus Angelobacter sp.]|nr:hypothetical protein [Candidatus Angelobacter sp.]